MTIEDNLIIEDMITKIKVMEPVVGKKTCQKYTQRTLQAYVKKGIISDIQKNEILDKLGY